MSRSCFLSVCRVLCGFLRVFAKDVATRAAHLSPVLFQGGDTKCHTDTRARVHYGDIRPQFSAKGSLRECDELNWDRRSNWYALQVDIGGYTWRTKTSVSVCVVFHSHQIEKATSLSSDSLHFLLKWFQIPSLGLRLFVWCLDGHLDSHDVTMQRSVWFIVTMHIGFYFVFGAKHFWLWNHV